MKITSILTYAAAASLAAFLVSLAVTPDAMISCAILAATMATLITIHDYTPRRYFVVTSSTFPASARKSLSAFPTIGAARRKSARRNVSLVA